jgi:gluconolactonase
MTHPFRLAPLALLLAACAGAPPTLPSAQTGTPGIAGVVNAGTPIEPVGEGFRGTEGPLGLPDGSLLFTENQGDRITRITPDGRSSVHLEGSNSANALALRSDGALLAVQTGAPRVGVLLPQAQNRTLAETFEGRAFGRPNDLVLGRDGTLWFTDSGPNAATPAPPGSAAPAVYRITPAGALERVAAGITRPNGIQLSPDDRVLYVANTAGEHVLAFDIGGDGRVGPPRNFARLAGFRQTPTGSSSGADGLAVDAAGRLYVATTVGVQVFSPSGEALGVITLPRAPQNLAFAGSDRKTLYIVGRGAVWRLPVLTAGVAGRAK